MDWTVNFLLEQRRRDDVMEGNGFEMEDLNLSSSQITQVTEETKESEISFLRSHDEATRLAEEVFLNCTIPEARALIDIFYRNFRVDLRKIDRTYLLTEMKKVSEALQPWIDGRSQHKGDAVILQIGLLLSRRTLLIASEQESDEALETSFFEQAQKYYSEILEENPVIANVLSMYSLYLKHPLIHAHLPAWLDTYWQNYCNFSSDSEPMQNASPSRSRKEKNIFLGSHTREEVREVLEYDQATLNCYLSGAVRAHEDMSRLYKTLDDKENAAKHLIEAKNICEQLNQPKNVSRITNKLQQLQSSRSNFQATPSFFSPRQNIPLSPDNQAGEVNEKKYCCLIL